MEQRLLELEVVYSSMVAMVEQTQRVEILLFILEKLIVVLLIMDI